MRYWEVQLVRTTVAEQYATAMRALEQTMTFLKALPLSEKKRASALLTWASPVFSAVAKVLYPMLEIRQKVDSLSREVMGVKSWGTLTEFCGR